MSNRPVAPDLPAGEQGGEVPSVIPDKIPSAIDTAAEEAATAAVPAAEPEILKPVENDPPAQSAEVELNQQGENTSVTDELNEDQLAALQEDHNTLNIIRNDPEAVRWLDQHFRNKARGGDVIESTGDENASPEQSELSAKVDKLFGIVDGLVTKLTQQEAKTGIAEFAAQNPVVREPKVAKKMQELLRQPGCESLSLKRVLTIALSELGMSDQTGVKAPLRSSESGGAPRMESSDEATIQKKIDSQESFEASLDAALRETAREQRFVI